jgi:hypothetical protein
MLVRFVIEGRKWQSEKNQNGAMISGGKLLHNELGCARLIASRPMPPEKLHP